MNIKKGSWTVLNSKIVYENKWISVREDQTIRPDGKPSPYAVVTMKPGVSVLPIDSDGNVYLVKEYIYAIEEETLQAVSGGIEKEEKTIDTAKRELKEEAGITATELIDLGYINPFTSVIRSPNYMFLAKGLSFSEAEPEGTEKIELVKMTIEEAIRLTMESKITHGATVALILKAKAYLGY